MKARHLLCIIGAALLVGCAPPAAPGQGPPPPMMQFLPLAVLMVLFGVLTYALARRKNRLAIVWGIFGAFFPVIALLILAFVPYLCPNCSKPLTNQEFAAKSCPRCNGTW